MTLSRTNRRKAQHLSGIGTLIEPHKRVLLPLPDLKAVVTDLIPLPDVSRVVIGVWQEPPFRKATYLIPDQDRLEAAKSVPNGSSNFVGRVIHSGVGLSRDHLIEAGRTFRFLPDLRSGAPVRNAGDILVIQPQNYAPRELSTFLNKIGAPGARVTLVGYEPVIYTDAVNRVIFPFHKKLFRLNTSAMRHFYRRFEIFPLRIFNDPAFEQRKERWGYANWRYADACTYLATMPSMKRLLGIKRGPELPDAFAHLQDEAALVGLKKAWGGAAKKHEVAFPLIVRSGFINR